MAYQGDQCVTFVDALAITTALSATATTPILGLAGAKYAVVEATMGGAGTGGTSIKAYVQTSVDQGATWCDIMCFAFANTAASKVSAVLATVALAAGVAPTDGTLADNTILTGLLGDRFRVKYVTVGTYSGSTTLTVKGIIKD